MQKTILGLLFLVLLSCTASAQSSYTYDVTFTVTTATGYHQVSFDESSHPLNAYGWVHVTDTGIDLWFSPDPNADLGDIPDANEEECYCSWDVEGCGKGRQECTDCEEVCNISLEINGNTQCSFTRACVAQ